MQTSLAAIRTNNAFAAACHANKDLWRSRMDSMLKVRSALLDTSGAAEQRDERIKRLRSTWRNHIYAAIRGQEEVESSLRKGRTPFQIPKFCEMSMSQWNAVEGPMHVRWLAKAYGLLGPILPYEAEAIQHVELSFKDLVAKRGNLLLSSDEMMYPRVRVAHCHPPDQFSLFLLDADYPNEGTKRREQYCLWSKTDLSPDKQGRLDATPTGDDQVLYEPPHPARGSDTHRIMVVVVRHQEPLPAQHILSKCRRMDIRETLSVPGVILVGYQFFRTCWTAKTSEFFKAMGITEPIFGKVLEMPPSLPPRFLNN